MIQECVVIKSFNGLLENKYVVVPSSHRSDISKAFIDLEYNYGWGTCSSYQTQKYFLLIYCKIQEYMLLQKHDLKAIGWEDL